MSALKRRPSLLASILWIGLGVLFLLRNFDIGPNLWALAGRYWPILLILLGLGKVIDYFRQKEGVSLRVGEVFGILLIFVIGSAISRVSGSAVGDLLWRVPIRIGDTEVALGSSYSYEQEASFPIAPGTSVRIENANGLVTVAPGSELELRVRLRKVVFGKEEGPAREVADRILIEGIPEGKAEAAVFLLRTNRETLQEGARFQTDMEVFLPRNVNLQIRNSYGAVNVTGLEGALDVSTSHKPLEVREIVGSVKASNRYGESRLQNLTGSLTVDARGRVDVEKVKGDVVLRNEYSPVSVRDVEGMLTVSNTEGSVVVEKVARPVTIDARGTQIRVQELSDSLRVTTSHRRVTISDVAANVALNSKYATHTLKNIRGNVEVESSYDTINLDEIAGRLKLKAVGTRVRANDIGGAVEVDTTLKDVVVNRFKNSCRVSNEYAAVELSAWPTVAHDITVKNRNGRIDLSLPAEGAFSLNASARNGRVQADFPGLQVEDRPGDVSSLRGAVKSGGPNIRLDTEYGNIRVRSTVAEKRSN